MDVTNSHAAGGSLQISSDVISKIARLATMEIEGVEAVAAGSSGAKGLVNKIAPPKPIKVDVKDDVADIEVSIIVRYGTKIPELSESIQQNVKASVQNMTSITVARVDVVVVGIKDVEEEAE